MAARRFRPQLVVLDRDGVINRDSSAFVKSADEWIPLPGSIDAIARLSRAGFIVAVASNQSGLARGLFDRRALTVMHRKLRRLVTVAGGRVDRIVVCPHGPDDGCRCRKPQPGLILRLMRFFDVAPSSTVFIGDSLRDLQAARNAHAVPVLVRTGNGANAERSLPDEFGGIDVFDNLAAAADALSGAGS